MRLHLAQLIVDLLDNAGQLTHIVDDIICTRLIEALEGLLFQCEKLFVGDFPHLVLIKSELA